MKKVCHVSSAHKGLDVRIFLKECKSLARAGYETHLIIGASKEDVERAVESDVKLHPLDYIPESRRVSRMVFQTNRCYRTAAMLEADLYHLHDPELIPYGLLLAFSGRHVVFDAHEDLPASIFSKEWVPLFTRKMVAAACRLLLAFSSRFFSAMVAATPAIAKSFAGAGSNVAVVNNYPLSGEFCPAQGPVSLVRNNVCYVGGIDAIRGIIQVVQALPGLGVTLQLAGPFASERLERNVSSLPGWNRVEYHGTVSRQNVSRILETSFAGIVTYLPQPNAIDSQPNKLFEYMSAGIPVIASHFPLWREIVEGAQCGICVDPTKPDEIAAAIKYLHDHPEEVARMGSNGRLAVETKYSWDHEENKLLSLYNAILNP